MPDSPPPPVVDELQRLFRSSIRRCWLEMCSTGLTRRPSAGGGGDVRLTRKKEKAEKSHAQAGVGEGEREVWGEEEGEEVATPSIDQLIVLVSVMSEKLEVEVSLISTPPPVLAYSPTPHLPDPPLPSLCFSPYATPSLPTPLSLSTSISPLLFLTLVSAPHSPLLFAHLSSSLRIVSNLKPSTPLTFRALLPHLPSLNAPLLLPFALLSYALIP